MCAHLSLFPSSPPPLSLASSLTPPSQVHSWLADVTQFVEDDENEFSYSIRLSAQDLLQSMGEEPGLADHTHSAIVSAVEKHLQGLTPHSSPHWWKVRWFSLNSVLPDEGPVCG